ncbi:DUF6504 family protein [Citricoccus nitrophenolicus]|uniref:DUF6504 domain-containing protein n=1 Tax=Citricoccus muralis TaxID=169134 RepID=A0A3D9L9E0_9MICC|nr:DUF6504 family protein [Citricoccus muralis]REE02978.1 hypothetical protein C8E99_0773 [Citricoccus muralis]
MGIFTQSVAVGCTTAGAPERLEWNGRIYVLAAEPVRWYERRKWWTEERRAERGRGAGLVDHEVWRVQVRLEKARNAPLLTLDLSHHVDSGRWRLVRVHDGAAVRLKESA